MPYTDIAVTERKYSVIYADPPWAYRTGTGKKWRSVAAHHYPVMSPEEITSLAGARKEWSYVHKHSKTHNGGTVAEYAV